VPVGVHRRAAILGHEHEVALVRAGARGVLDRHVGPRAGDDHLVAVEAAEQRVEHRVLPAAHPHLLDDVIAGLRLDTVGGRGTPRATDERAGVLDAVEERRVQLPEDEMLARLRATLKRRGRLSSAIINDTVGLPCTATYMEHFGTIRNAYRLIGYTTKRDCDWIDSGQHWADAVAKLVHQVDAAIEKTGKHLSVTGAADGLLVNGTVGISFRVARWWPGKEAHHSPRWAIQHRKHLPPGWVVAIRLAESNRAVLDYLLLPTSKLAGRMIKFTEKARDCYKARRFETSDALIRSIIGHVAPAGRSLAKSIPRSKPSRSRKPRSKIGRGPH